jgi:hypothetical protein
MNCLLVLMLALAPAAEAKDAPKADAAKAEPTKTAPQPLEKVLAEKTRPSGDQIIMVQSHILVHNANGKKGMSVKFVDVEGSPNVNIKKWDKKLGELKPETTILVTGELHIGSVSGGTPSIRYKVREANGKKYNDHRHWRTDQAVYITNPTYEVVSEGKPDEKKPDKKKDEKKVDKKTADEQRNS